MRGPARGGAHAAAGRWGIRNSHLLAIAPAGSISLLAGGVSSGIEPLFGLAYTRRVRQPDGAERSFAVEAYSSRIWQDLHGEAPLPAAFARARDVSPEGQLAMAAALQPYVDSSISRTVHVPTEMGFEVFSELYGRAHDLGLKGCAAWRPNPVTGGILEPGCGAACGDAA